MRRPHIRVLAAIFVMLAVLSSCGSDSGSKLSGTVQVYAAQSLTKAFTDLGKAFEARHAGTTVKFAFGGSSTLVAQITQGAPADVFASADQANMDRLTTARLTDGASTVFAANRLEIVVAKGNPKRITGLADLARPGTIVSLCAAGVPCGTYGTQALAKAGVAVTPKTTESSVAGVIGRIATGEADAGIVYVTDVLAAPKVDGVAIPEADNVIARYPMAVLKSTAHRKVADAFVAFVGSGAGQAILAKYGFLHA